MNWTTRADVIAALRKRWVGGQLLGTFAAATAMEPISIALRGPKSGEIGSNFAAVQAWVRSWREERTLRVEFAPIGGRLIGANELPKRVWVDDYVTLWKVLGVTAEANRLVALTASTSASAPKLVSWMTSHPHSVLGFSSDAWTKIVATVRWVDTLADQSVYLRQIDVPGVDTKFIETNRSVIAALLDLQLDESRIDRSQQASDFEMRYGFRRKPRYVRYRWLDPDRTTAGHQELTVRVEEFAPLDVSHVFVLENEVTYLAFPEVRNAIAIFGGGYSLTRLNELAWLSAQSLIYWGDLDTHGFTILDTLRRNFPSVRSMLMDRATLLAHRTQWVCEQSKAIGPLLTLTPAETALYQGLCDDIFGPSVRLEQERIQFSAITSAIQLILTAQAS